MEIKGIDFLRLVLTLPSKSFRPGDRLAKAKETLEEVLINLIQYQIKSILYSCFRSFYPMSSLCSRILPRNHVTFGCHVSLGFSRLWHFIWLSLFQWPWPFWGTLVRHFVERYSVWICPVVVFMVTLRSWILGKNTRFLSRRGKMPFLIHCCQGAHDASMTSWVRWCLPGFFTLKLVSFSFAILFFGSTSLSGPPSRTVSTCVWGV